MRARLVLMIGLLALVVCRPAPARGDYVFTKIADTAGMFSGFGGSPSAPSINDAATVAFFAMLDAGGEGLFTGDGFGPTATIVTADFFGPNAFLGIPTTQPAINALGVVAFKGALDTGVTGIYVGDGGPLGTIADATSVFYDDFGTAPAINDAGLVAFSSVSAGLDGVYAGTKDAGVTTTIVDSGPFSGFLDGGFSNGVSVNELGVVAFVGLIAPGPIRGVYKGAGVGVTPIADESIPEVAPTLFLNAPAINDAGTVAFRSARDAGGEGVFTGSGGALATVATSDGAYSGFEPAGLYPAINNAGDVAFFAGLDGGGHGIFTGPDSVADKVVKAGDALDGSTVTDLRFSRLGLNNSGDVAFWAMLSDGRSGIFVASPPPLPGDFNDDGMVDGDDLAQWQGDFGVNGESDADADGDSDGADFLVWQQYVGASNLGATATPVPETGGWALMGGGALALIGAGRRR